MENINNKLPTGWQIIKNKEGNVKYLDENNVFYDELPELQTITKLKDEIKQLHNKIKCLEEKLEIINLEPILLELSTTKEYISHNRDIIWDKIIHNTNPKTFYINESVIEILKPGYYEIIAILIGQVGQILDYYVYANDICVINGGHHNHISNNYHTGCLVSCVKVNFNNTTKIRVNLYSQCPGIIVNNQEGIHNRLIIKKL